jgi:hypothetical protein
VDGVVLAWLHYAVTEHHYTHRVNADSATYTSLNYWEKRLDRAQHRYLKAVEMLARVRRLAVPMVQINVAQPGARQLNVAAATPAPNP